VQYRPSGCTPHNLEEDISLHFAWCGIAGVLSHTRPPYHAEGRSDMISMNKSSLRLRTHFRLSISVCACSGGRRAYLHTLKRACKIILDCIQKGRENHKPFDNAPKLKQTRDSSVGIATGYGLDSRSSIPGTGTHFLFSTASKSTLAPRLLTNEHRGIFPRV
jgi:hypothetical protein